MRVPPAFSSPLLLEAIQKAPHSDRMMKHLQTALPAMAYYLDKALPTGGTICALYPKGILGELLPLAAREKKCTVISIQGTQEATQALLEAGVLDNTADMEKADVFLIEPDGFSPGGALIRPEETVFIEQFQPIAIGCALQWTMELPATHDYIPVQKIITELGVLSPENFMYEFTRAFSWLTLSVPSRASKAQPAIP